MVGDVLPPGPVPRFAGAGVRQYPADAFAAVEGFFVGIHILIRPAEKGQVVGVRMRVEHREALGNRKLRIRMDRLPVHPENGFLQLRAQTVHLLAVRAFHDSDELVPADPEDALPAENLRESIGRLNDDPVAGFMSAEVVDLLQVVDIENSDGEGSFPVRDLSVQMVHLFQVCIPAACAGHQVALRLGIGIKDVFLQTALGLLQAFPDGFDVTVLGSTFEIRAGVPIRFQADRPRQLFHVVPQFHRFLADPAKPRPQTARNHQCHADAGCQRQEYGGQNDPQLLCQSVVIPVRVKIHGHYAGDFSI